MAPWMKIMIKSFQRGFKPMKSTTNSKQDCDKMGDKRNIKGSQMWQQICIEDQEKSLQNFGESKECIRSYRDFKNINSNSRVQGMHVLLQGRATSCSRNMFGMFYPCTTVQ
jgi:hypothetical protein